MGVGSAVVLGAGFGSGATALDGGVGAGVAVGVVVGTGVGVGAVVGTEVGLDVGAGLGAGPGAAVGFGAGAALGAGAGVGAGAPADAVTAPDAFTSKLNVLFAEACSGPPAVTLMRSLPFEGVALTVYPPGATSTSTCEAAACCTV